MLLPIILALAAAPAVQPAPAAGQPGQPNTFIIHRPIVAEPVAARDATDGLFADLHPDHERDRQREDDEDVAIEHAFDEAVDQARSIVRDDRR